MSARSDWTRAPGHQVPAFRKFRFTGWDRGMSLPWSALRERFAATIRSTSTPRLFRYLRTDLGSLAPFLTAEDLIAYLERDLSADLEAKDELYSQLVLAARGGEPASPLAHALLWIGLWPGLSAAFFRRLWFWQDCPDELVSEMTTAFTTLIARLDLGRVRRVVGTLVRSTERDVIQAHLARTRDQEHLPYVGCNPGDICEAKACWDPHESESVLLTALRRSVDGKVSDQVFRALVLGLGAPYLVAVLGLSPAAARQRLCRARRRLRSALADDGVAT